MSYILACSKPWCNSLTKQLKLETKENFISINSSKDLSWKNISEINPKYIFFPHWSTMIPKKIYNNYDCIIFHMTDLPYGRGGSPLQNLIIRGHDKTMISGIKCTSEIDAGPIYLKKELSLNGSAKEIFARANDIIKQMIIEILINDPQPKSQKGEIVNFKRRNLEDGNLINAKSLNEVYDYIRMLDAEGYPQSFVLVGDYLFEFSNASISNNEVVAKVKIKWRKNNE